MDRNDISASEKNFKQFVLILSYAILIYFVSGYFLFYMDSWLRICFLITAVIHIAGAIALNIIPPQFIKRIAIVYYVFLMVSIYPLSVYDMSTGSVDSLFWWISAPVIAYAFYPDKKGVRLAGLCFCLMLSAFILAFVLRSVLHGKAPLETLPSSLPILVRAGMINAAYSLLTIGLSLRYLNSLRQIEKNSRQQEIERLKNILSSVEDKKSRKLMEAGMEEKEKNEQLFQRIVNYFETEKPYLDADFTLYQLSTALGVNTVYLSRAINEKKDMNFSIFVNFYRINRVKELMQQVNVERYTMQYIYSAAGFKNQSSFNRAFKELEGMTPSEYLERTGIKQVAKTEVEN